MFPLDLISQVTGRTGPERRRLLPAASVMIFVLGCALFSGEGYAEVVRKVEIWLEGLAGPGGWRIPGTSALARARRRVGPAPLRMLFALLAGPLAGPGTPGAYAFGRLLAALDGTLLDVRCSPANTAAFGAPQRNGSSSGGYPQVRLVTVVACGTRGILDAAFRGCRAPGASEQDLARKIAARGRLGPGMLVLADRNFGGYQVAATLAATGADLLIRVKTASARWLPALRALPDGSYLSVLPVPASGRAHARARHEGRPLATPPAGLAVRVIEADITSTPAGGGPRTERYRLITTLQLLLPGAYLTTSGQPTRDQRKVAAQLYAGPDSLITGPAALEFYGIQGRRSATVDVLVPVSRRTVSRDFAVMHRTRRMPQSWSPDLALRYALPQRAVADAVAALTRLSDARTVVASAVQQRRCTVRQLSAELRERHDARDAMFRRVLAEVAAGARSAPEADLQELIAAFSLPVPLFNPSLFLDGKFLACPDAWWPQSAVAVEVDSKQWHLLPEDWERTMRRHRQMSAAGIRVIHVSPAQLRDEARAVARDIAGALARGHPAAGITCQPAAA